MALQHGAQVLGLLLARAVGMPLADVFRSGVFELLGMTDTAFFTTDTDRLATAYALGDGGLEIWDPPGGAWSTAQPFSDGASGLASTADDLLAFGRMLLRGGSPVLSREAVQLMTSDQLSPAQREGPPAALLGEWSGRSAGPLPSPETVPARSAGTEGSEALFSSTRCGTWP